MYDDKDDDNEDYSQPDIEDLESRIEALESNENQGRNNYYNSCSALLYIPGLVLAMILSYDANQSILWTILHGFLSWGYVIYRVFF